jgi:hypothetical protein
MVNELLQGCLLMVSGRATCRQAGCRASRELQADYVLTFSVSCTPEKMNMKDV